MRRRPFQETERGWEGGSNHSEEAGVGGGINETEQSRECMDSGRSVQCPLNLAIFSYSTMPTDLMGQSDAAITG